jgi:hypothetical protein
MEVSIVNLGNIVDKLNSHYKGGTNEKSDNCNTHGCYDTSCIC